MVHFPFHGNRLAYVRPIKGAITKPGFIWIVDWSNMWSKEGASEERLSLKERPAECSFGNPKRRFSEDTSDHSLHTVTIRRLGLRFLHHWLTWWRACPCEDGAWPVFFSYDVPLFRSSHLITLNVGPYACASCQRKESVPSLWPTDNVPKEIHVHSVMSLYYFQDTNRSQELKGRLSSLASHSKGNRLTTRTKGQVVNRNTHVT